MGQPLKYPTPEALSVVINKYFKVTPFKEYTITGLALEVGSKQLIQDYEKRQDYAEVIKRAKLIVENSYEISLRVEGHAGNIFALKNFGWVDKTEVVHDIKDGLLDKFKDMTTEALKQKADELLNGKRNGN